MKVRGLPFCKSISVAIVLGFSLITCSGSALAQAEGGGGRGNGSGSSNPGGPGGSGPGGLPGGPKSGPDAEPSSGGAVNSTPDTDLGSSAKTNNHARPLSEVLQFVRNVIPGTVLDVETIRSVAGTMHYKIKMLDGYTVRWVTVDAVAGTIVSVN